MISVQAEETPAPRDFAAAIRRIEGDGIKLIAELKKKSPSKGTIRRNFNAEALLRTYDSSPASALSVLTDWTFFEGKIDYIELAHRLTTKPTLRKDFIIDPYQVHEARAFGADAILLITTILDANQLADLLILTKELNMTALVETHTESEIDAALLAGAEIVGINNRDLTTFEVDIATTPRLRARIPDAVTVVSESGIESADDVKQLSDAGIDAILVGETLMRADKPDVKARNLLGVE